MVKPLSLGPHPKGSQGKSHLARFGAGCASYKRIYNNNNNNNNNNNKKKNNNNNNNNAARRVVLPGDLQGRSRHVGDDDDD